MTYHRSRSNALRFRILHDQGAKRPRSLPMNKYRVDRVPQQAALAHCGMNSIIYLGDSLFAAKAAYAKTRPGFNDWGVKCSNYGVAVFRWDEKSHSYQLLLSKY